MPIRRIKKDPRTREQKEADDEVLDVFEKGEFLPVDPAVEREAVEYVQRMNRERREIAAQIAKMLGEFRQMLGVSQEEVAKLIGTQKTFISRVESGRYGGLTMERFMAMFEAIHLSVTGSSFLGFFSKSRRTRIANVHHEELDRFRSLSNCLE